MLVAGCSGPQTEQEPDYPIQPIPTEHRQEIVLTAMGLMGSPYRFGGSDPDIGFDCSGLVKFVFRKVAGAQLPRTTGSQAAISRRIVRRDLRPGDLVFFNTLGKPNSHVGIYIGNDQFVNAPSSGGRVRIDSMHNPYFAKRFTAARTLFANR